MQINLYKTKSERIRIKKVLEDELVLNGSLRDQSSIITPTFALETNPIGYNYCYIPAFGRYYYIKNIVAVRKNLFQLQLKCDVLMTYQTEIYALQALIDREENTDTSYVDGDFVVDSRPLHEKIEFTSPFTEENYVLVALKGSATNGKNYNS